MANVVPDRKEEFKKNVQKVGAFLIEHADDFFAQDGLYQGDTMLFSFEVSPQEFTLLNVEQRYFVDYEGTMDDFLNSKAFKKTQLIRQMSAAGRLLIEHDISDFIKDEDVVDGYTEGKTVDLVIHFTSPPGTTSGYIEFDKLVINDKHTP